MVFPCSQEQSDDLTSVTADWLPNFTFGVFYEAIVSNVITCVAVILLQNSIRHNLSLHSKFVRVQNEGNGKSSWWMLNPDAKGGKTSRRRSGSLDSAPKSEKKRGRTKKEKIKEEDGESPSSPRLSVNRARDGRANSPRNVSPTNSSSSDSLLTIPESESPLPFPLGDSFARPRTSSNASTVSSLGGRLSPIPAHGDELEAPCEDHVPSNNFNLAGTSTPVAEELTKMANSMSLDPFAAENNRLKQTLTPIQPSLLPSEPHNDLGIAVSNGMSSKISSSFDTSYNNSGYIQPIQRTQQSLSPEILPPQTIAAPRPAYGNLRVFNPPSQQPHFQQRSYCSPQERQNTIPTRVNDMFCRDQEMEVQQSPDNSMFQNFQPSYANGINGLAQNHQTYTYSSDPFVQQHVGAGPVMMENGIHSLQGHPFTRVTNNNQLEFMNEKFPSDLELDAFHGDFDCDLESIICDEMNMGDGGFDINLEQFISQIPNVGEIRSGLY